VAVTDWLVTPTQRLAEFTGGRVFHDGPGDLSRARARLTWYPRDVWLCVLACQWERIAQEEAFPGRCAEAGDELGSAADQTAATDQPAAAGQTAAADRPFTAWP
jgi:hypothetical protein